jgi:hypothetical protein
MPMRPRAGGLKASADAAANITITAAFACIFCFAYPVFRVSLSTVNKYRGPFFWEKNKFPWLQLGVERGEDGGSMDGQDAPKGRAIPFVTLETEVSACVSHRSRRRGGVNAT